MATKKWLGLAAVLAAVGGAVGYGLTRVKKGPEAPAQVQGGNGSDQQIDAEMETAAS